MSYQKDKRMRFDVAELLLSQLKLSPYIKVSRLIDMPDDGHASVPYIEGETLSGQYFLLKIVQPRE